MTHMDRLAKLDVLRMIGNIMATPNLEKTERQRLLDALWELSNAGTEPSTMPTSGTT